MIVHERNGRKELVLEHQTHERVHARVKVGHEHERYARHCVRFDNIVLPGTGKTVRYEIAEQTHEPGQGGFQHLRSLVEIVFANVAEQKYAYADQEHAHVLDGPIGFIRDEFARQHDEYRLARFGQQLRGEAHVFERFVLKPTTQHVRQ